MRLPTCASSKDAPPNGRAFSGEPSERSERPERKRGRRVRCNAMLGGVLLGLSGDEKTEKEQDEAWKC